MKRKLQIIRYKLKKYKAFETVYHFLNQTIYFKLCRKYHVWQLHRNGAEILRRLDAAMTECGCEYWLDYGTLLGAMREHDFIRHDHDIDTGCLWQGNLPSLEKVMLKHGFKKSSQISVGNQVTEQSYDILGTSVDIFFYFPNEEAGGIRGWLFNAIEPYGWNETLVRFGGYGVRSINTKIEGFETIKFKGVDVKVPGNWDWYLKNVYGESYMTPDPAFKHSTTTAITHHKDKLGVAEFF